MEIVLFKIHPRQDIDEAEYAAAFQHMLACVAQVHGFVSIDGFAGEDGSELAVALFESPEAIEEWRVHPEHALMQRRGREEFFVSYEISIATVWKQYGWPGQPTKR